MRYKLATRSCRSEDGIAYQFQYFLLTELAPSPHFFCELYGVQIIDNFGNEASFPAITTSPGKIDQFATLLVEHLVGPATLESVVTDWLAQEKSGADQVGTAG